MIYSSSFLTSLFFVFGFISLSNANEEIVYSFNSLNDFPLDENNRLREHLLVYPESAHCQNFFSDESFSKIDLRNKASLPMELLAQFLGSDKDEVKSDSCPFVCLERGTHIDSLVYPIPTLVNLGGIGTNVNEWLRENCQKTEIGFINYHHNDANIFWYNEAKDLEVNIGRLGWGERNTSWHTSYLGHQFRIRDQTDGTLLAEYTVQYHSINHVKEQSSRLQVKERVEASIEDTLNREWARSKRVKRTFTEFGFNRGRLPNDLWASMSTYYYNNKDNKALEQFGNHAVIVNWWETNVYYIPMPWKLKKYWQARLKDLVEAWSGVELELTDIYGMRRYEDGARLLTHVDREATHAASLIINIAQGKIRKPWTVEIYDFSDRLHEVVMNEGDIVYYESARCLHGRMQPLEGEFYVNLFAHYRPTGDPEWFLKDNPENTPKPIHDIGECSSNGTAVTCTSDAYIPFLSPKLDVIKGPDDLFDFWSKHKPQKNNIKEEL